MDTRELNASVHPEPGGSSVHPEPVEGRTPAVAPHPPNYSHLRPEAVALLSTTLDDSSSNSADPLSISPLSSAPTGVVPPHGMPDVRQSAIEPLVDTSVPSIARPPVQLAEAPSKTRSERTPPPDPIAPSRRPRWIFAAVAVLVAVVAGVAISQSRKPVEPTPTPPPPEVVVAPVPVVDPPPQPAVVPDPPPEVAAPVVVPVAEVREKPKPAPATGIGWLTLDVRPGWAQVRSKGVDLGVTPLVKARFPAGTHPLDLVRQDGTVKKVKVTIRAQQTTKLSVPWE